MISALRKLEVGQDDKSSNSTEQTTKFLKACYLIFEKGILSHMKITDDDSTPLKNIREGMKSSKNGRTNTKTEVGFS